MVIIKVYPEYSAEELAAAGFSQAKIEGFGACIKDKEYRLNTWQYQKTINPYSTPHPERNDWNEGYKFASMNI